MGKSEEDKEKERLAKRYEEWKKKREKLEQKELATKKNPSEPKKGGFSFFKKKTQDTHKEKVKPAKKVIAKELEKEKLIKKASEKKSLSLFKKSPKKIKEEKNVLPVKVKNVPEEKPNKAKTPRVKKSFSWFKKKTTSDTSKKEPHPKHEKLAHDTPLKKEEKIVKEEIKKDSSSKSLTTPVSSKKSTGGFSFFKKKSSLPHRVSPPSERESTIDKKKKAADIPKKESPPKTSESLNSEKASQEVQSHFSIKKFLWFKKKDSLPARITTPSDEEHKEALKKKTENMPSKNELFKTKKKDKKPIDSLDHLTLKQLSELRKRENRLHMRKVPNRQLLRKYLDKAGYEFTNEKKMIRNVFRIVIALCMLFTMIALIIASIGKPGGGQTLLFVVGIWTAVFAGLFVLSWVVLYVFLDLKIFNRTQLLEDVLPDYLQLVSANISAGMPIDRALWFAVRPRFGILAKEIEQVAKSTFSGVDLKDALMDFSRKYDSIILHRSVNLLIEGMEAGGEMAELINKIAINIQETKIMKKEMAANVMTYAIFISFATIVAAPILYGLSGQLLIIIQEIMGVMAQASGDTGATNTMLSIDLSGESIKVSDYNIFAFTTLMITSMFSGFIVSAIRKGNIKEGFRFIPAMMLATMILYFISRWILGLLLSGIVQV